MNKIESPAVTPTSSTENLILLLLIKPLKAIICYIVTYFILKIKQNFKNSVNFHKKEKNMDKTRELSYNELIENLTQLSSLHPVIDFSYIGNSILDRPIPLITLGDKNAEKSILYVGTHHACENICTSVLLRFINEYIGAYERFGQICQINMHYLNKMRKIHIVPMLNPDGVEYRLHGLENNNPIKDRVIAYPMLTYSDLMKSLS